MDALVEGPRAVRWVTLALDTGATRTVLSPRTLSFIGYDMDSSPRQNVVGVNGTSSVPLVPVSRLNVGDITRRRLTVAAMALPSAIPADGLLGTDFLSSTEFTVNIGEGWIDIRPATGGT